MSSGSTIDAGALARIPCSSSAMISEQMFRSEPGTV